MIRRRQSLALPFVMTVAVAPACDDEKTSNPPPPQVEHPDTSVGAGTKDPDAEPPIDKPGTDAPGGETPNLKIAQDTWTVERNPDGTCTKYFSVDCPEGVKCNPPPPDQVPCPDDSALPDAPDREGDLFVDAQGYCNFAPKVECPPNVPCNPPVPERVKCPKDFTGK